jgi:hypothetical protein
MKLIDIGDGISQFKGYDMPHDLHVYRWDKEIDGVNHNIQFAFTADTLKYLPECIEEVRDYFKKKMQTTCNKII